MDAGKRELLDEINRQHGAELDAFFAKAEAPPAQAALIAELEEIAQALLLEAGDCSQRAPLHPEFMAEFLFKQSARLRAFTDALRGTPPQEQKL